MSEERFDHRHPEVPKDIHPEVAAHREKQKFHLWWVGDWRWPTLAVAFVILWGMLIYGLMGERPRTWQYGVPSYVPAQSYLSSREPNHGKVPRQLPVVPKARGEARAR